MLGRLIRNFDRGRKFLKIKKFSSQSDDISKNTADPRIKTILRVVHANWSAYVNFEKGREVDLNFLLKLEDIDQKLVNLLDKYDVKESNLVSFRNCTAYNCGKLLSILCEPTTVTLSKAIKELSSNFLDDSLRESFTVARTEYDDVRELLKNMRDLNCEGDSGSVFSNFPTLRQLSHIGYNFVSKIHEKF